MWVEQLLVENSTQCDVTDINEVNNNTEVTDQESDDTADYEGENGATMKRH